MCLSEKQLLLWCRVALKTWAQHANSRLVELIRLPLEASSATPAALLESELARFNVGTLVVSLLVSLHSLRCAARLVGSASGQLVPARVVPIHVSLIVHALVLGAELVLASLLIRDLLVDDARYHVVDFARACHYTDSKSALVHSRDARDAEIVGAAVLLVVELTISGWLLRPWDPLSLVDDVLLRAIQSMHLACHLANRFVGVVRQRAF